MSEDRNLPLSEVDAPEGARFAIVWSRFNQHVVAKLIDGAKGCFAEHGVDETRLHVVEVPGAWELPLVARKLAQSGRFAAVVALGAVIRGGTPHFEYVSEGTALGLMQAGLDTGVPVVFGVLTTDDEAQALDRAGGAHGNKGHDAARTAIEMAALDQRLADDGIATKGP